MNSIFGNGQKPNLVNKVDRNSLNTFNPRCGKDLFDQKQVVIIKCLDLVSSDFYKSILML